MESKRSPSGVGKSVTPSDILMAELEKIEVDRNRLKEESSAYLRKHPEIANLMDELLSSMLYHKPSDIAKYASQFFRSKRDPSKAGSPPLIFAGPSGSGKTTLVNLVMKTHPKIFGFCTSHTTRAPRPGETNGVQYYFIEKAAFEFAIKEGQFIEYADVHTNLYGTSYKSVENVRGAGKICILDIDIQGVHNLKQSELDCRYIFIAPPSMEVLQERLKSRATETEDKIRIRLNNAAEEMKFGKQLGNFDHVVINDQLDRAYDEIIASLKEWYPEIDF